MLALAIVLPQLSFSQEAPPGQVPPPAEPAERMFEGRGNFEGQIMRSLRYWPQGTDFVITNGGEFFNRPLYGLNSAFRVDGGDKPEFSLYLPGRGGNLRFGVKTKAGAKWLNDAKTVVTRYRPGSLIYEIRDPLLGRGVLNLTVLPLSETKGMVARVELRGAKSPVELVWAFGGANGQRGRRNGDIGCEREPISQFFQLRPEQCRGDTYSIGTNTFTLSSPRVTLSGVFSQSALLGIGDAENWNDLPALLAATGRSNAAPVLVATIDLQPDSAWFMALRPVDAQAEPLRFDAAALPEMFQTAEARRRAMAERVVVETPDPFVNAAAAALCVAGDGIWDEAQGAFMHGAVAWRNKLLGWRGPYTGDALGWHDRARRHFNYWAGQQITSPIPDSIPPADPASNLSRNEPALHSNGAMSKSHYDMNLVYIDALFRHLLWTGDREFARQVWPVIERHLAWERRLFRRVFGPEKLPLYEGYAAIWASDDMAYNGGGAAHASAYNYWHNKMAARVAKSLGQDAAPYEREAELIAQAMRRYLWSADQGCFAEWKDYLGLQLVHTNAGLWSIYHTIDSEVTMPVEAWQMTRYVDTQIAHIPLQISYFKSHISKGQATESKFLTLPTTSWMPYTWSLNNVVMAEVAHTSLAYWQADRPYAAFSLFKGCLLDSMFLGLCPGNLGMTTWFDMARGEAQRDFADAVGITSRALVEGLFGVKPDALAGELTVRPGFPAAWNSASLRHPDFHFTFRRKWRKETYVWESKFPKSMALRLQIPALRDGVARVTVNGRPAEWKWLKDVVGGSRIEVQSAAASSKIVVTWKGKAPARTPFPAAGVSEGGPARRRAGAKEVVARTKTPPTDVKFETVDLSPLFNDRVTQIFRNEYLTPRSPFCSLATPKQGIGSWCNFKTTFEVDDTGLRAVAATNGGKLILPNGVPFETPTNADTKNIIFTSQWDNYPREATVPLSGKASHAWLLMAGSTSAMQSRFDNGEVVVTYTDGSSERLALNNPANWWPIDQDYFIDDYAFRRPEPIPPRVDLKTGNVRVLDVKTFKGKGGKVPGGAATVLDLPLQPEKELQSLTVRALANEVVIGLMAVTLARDD